MARITSPTEPEVVHISRSQIYKDHLGDDKPPIRYANMDIAPTNNDVAYEYATVKGKNVLRETEAGRRNLQATFFETDRKISGLSITFFTKSTGNLHPKGSVSLWGQEIQSLLNFIETMQKIKFPGTGKLIVEPGALDHSHFVSDSDVTNALRKRPELLKEVLENPDLDKDMKAIGYWRKSLNEFEKLLSNETYFNSVKVKISKNSAEQVWQEYFEKNKWIFGYGLLYISTVGVVDEKLEQSLQSGSIFGSGSKPDALMRTRGAMSNLCLVEIKIHTAPLVSKEKRGGSFLISKELSDAVSQCQTAISVAEERIHQHFQLITKDFQPPIRFLIIVLDQFL